MYTCYVFYSIATTVRYIVHAKNWQNIYCFINKLAMVYCNSWVLIGLQAMVYELIYHWPQISGWCTRQQEQLGSSNIAIIWMFFNKTILPHALVRYEIVIANSAQRAVLPIVGYLPSHIQRALNIIPLLQSSTIYVKGSCLCSVLSLYSHWSFRQIWFREMAYYSSSMCGLCFIQLCSLSIKPNILTL